MLIRIISGIIAAALLVFVLLLPPVFFAAAVLAVSCVALYEYRSAMKQRGINVDLPVSWAAALVITAHACISTLPEESKAGISGKSGNYFPSSLLFAAVFVIVAYLFCRMLYGNRKMRLDDAAYTLLGIAYIPFLLSFAVMVRNMDRGFEYIWLVVIGASVTDIFAYFAGTFFGRHKIIPDISPKKTVEGSLGGALGCMVTMMLYGIIFLNRHGIPPVAAYHFAAMGLLCGVLSQIGDWSASAVKRSAGIKDFGWIIPGHGGIMDRCDSYLFVAPAVYFYIILFF